jgi:hypothetical protein
MQGGSRTSAHGANLETLPTRLRKKNGANELVAPFEFCIALGNQPPEKVPDYP